jgi:hypothetical protein
LPQDLNEGAGGTYNYLCVQRGGPGPRYIDVDFEAHSVGSFAKRCGELNSGWTAFPQNLNTGTKLTGELVYLFYRIGI